MKKRIFSIIVVFVMTLSLFNLKIALAVDPDYTVEKWRMVEITLTSTVSYGDPFNSADLTATFSGPDSTVIVRPGFWDGGNTWKIRFAPTKTGDWNMTTTCSDTSNSGLHNVTKLVHCDAYTGNLAIYQKGFLKTSATGRYFTYDDGTPFFYLGDTHWRMAHERWDTSNHEGIESEFKYIVDKRVDQGFTVYQSQPVQTGHTGDDEEDGYYLHDGLSSYDLAGFANLDRKYQYIADQGLVHANAMIDYTNFPFIGESKTEAYMARLGKYWAARYGAYPVMWTIAQEVDKNYYDAYNSTQMNMWYTAAQSLSDNDGYNHPLGPHMENKWVVNADTSWWESKPYHSFWALQTIDFEASKTYWNYDTPKPAVLYEGFYEHFWTDTDGARKQGYQAFQLGVYGYGYGVDGVWNDLYSHYPEDYGVGYQVDTSHYLWYEGANALGADQLTYMKNFYTSLDWWNLTPRFDDANWSSLTDGYVSSDGNATYVVFFNTGSSTPGTLKNMNTTATYTAKWFNTKNGTYTTISNNITPTNGEYTIPATPDSTDWILLVSTGVASDTQAPTAPTNLASASITSTSFDLSWTASTDNVAVIGYDIYNGSTLVGSTISATSYTVTGLTANTSYTFTVKAKDASANISAASSGLSVTTAIGDGGGTDLAQLATLTASETDTANGYSTAKAINGNTGDFDGWSSTGSTNAWLQLEWGSSQSIGRVDLYSTTGYLFSGYKIQTWNGSAWVDQATTGNTVKLKTTTFSSVSTTKLRIYGTAGDMYGRYRIDEIKVYGSTDAEAPSAPSNLSYSSKNSTSVSLTWSAASDNVGVTGYDVYYGTTLAGSTASTSYTVSGLTPSTAYSFTVRAKDAAGNVSSASNTLNVSTDASGDTEAPTAPTNLAYTARTTSTVSLSWTASTDNVAVTGYDVYYGGTTLAGSTSGTTYTVTGLSSNTSYTFTVKAKDLANNISSASSGLNVTTDPINTSNLLANPGFESGSTSWMEIACSISTSATAHSGTYAALVWNRAYTWSAPYQDIKDILTTNGQGYYSYSVWAMLASGTDNVNIVIKTNDSTGDHYFQNSASIGSSTYGQINASSINITWSGTLNSAGLFISTASSTGNIYVDDFILSKDGATDTQAPTTPGNLSLTGKTSTSVSMSWTASTDNVAVTGYDIYNGSTLAGSTSGTTCTVTGLSANTSYTFTVKAKDAASNVSSASNGLNVTTDFATDTQAPTTPTNLGSTGKTSTSVSLSWTASSDNVAVTGYDVYYGTTLAGSTTTATTFTVTGLSASTAYTFTVKAKDAANNISSASSGLTVTTDATPDTQAPTAPTNLSSPSKTATSVSLSWTASTDNVAVTGYDVYYGTQLAGSTSNTSYTVTGLSANTQYTFTVKAKDGSNNVSSASSGLNVTTEATSVTNLLSNPGFESGTTPWIEIACTVALNGSAHSGSYSALVSSRTYTYSAPYQDIKDILTANGQGYYTFSVWAKLASGLNSVTVVIKTNDSTGDHYFQSSASIGTTFDQIIASSKNITWSGTLNSAGIFMSTDSSTANMYVDDFVLSKDGATDTEAPTAPTNLAYTSKTASSVSLSWTAATDNTAVTGYDVYYGATLAGSTANTTYTVTGLSSNTQYTFTVKAKDAANNISSASSGLNVTTEATDNQAPTAPTNLSSPSKSSTTVSLSWTASTDNVAVTGYDVYYGATLAGSTSSTTYTVTGLSANTQYTFTVKAKDAVNNISSASSGLNVTTNQSSDTNIAPSATVTASETDTNNGYSTGEAVDGNTGDFSGWATNAFADGDWLQLEWGSAQSIGRVVLYSTTDYLFDDYYIQYWNGSSWVDIVRTGNTLKQKTTTFTPVSTTKLRIYGMSGDGYGVFRIDEIQVYGE